MQKANTRILKSNFKTKSANLWVFDLVLLSKLCFQSSLRESLRTESERTLTVKKEGELLKNAHNKAEKDLEQKQNENQNCVQQLQQLRSQNTLFTAFPNLHFLQKITQSSSREVRANKAPSRERKVTIGGLGTARLGVPKQGPNRRETSKRD